MLVSEHELLVVAHDDWDGVVSSIFLFPTRVKVMIIDYYELDSVPAGRRVFVEVHDPKIMSLGDFLVDHHEPKLEIVASHYPAPLTGYLFVNASHPMVYYSSNVGRDYSNVRAVQSLYPNLQEWDVFAAAIRPPEDIARISDVLDNFDLAKTVEEENAVIGYILSWSREEAHRLSLCRTTPDPASCIRSYAIKYVMTGEQMRDTIEAKYGQPQGQTIYVARTENGRKLAKLLSWLACRSRDCHFVANAHKTPRGYRITILTRDDTALRIARELGGGGRRKPPTGYVAGATIPDLKILVDAIHRHLGIRPKIVKVNESNYLNPVYQ